MAEHERDEEQDARQRLEHWIEKLSRQSERLMAIVDAAIDGTLGDSSGDDEEDESRRAAQLDPFQAAQILSKHLALIGKFLAQRQQFTTGGGNMEQLLLEAILGVPGVKSVTEIHDAEEFSTITEQDEPA